MVLAVPLVVIAIVVVLGNLPYVLGVFDPNPINTTSGLGLITRGGALPGNFSIDPNNGFTSQALGHLAVLDILRGHLPWWNPYEGVGAPLAGEMNGAALFPPTLLLVFSTGQLPFHMLLEAVAGMATCRLLLRLGVGRWAATAGGCVFALNGTFSWFQHATVNPIAFLPLLLLGVERARDAAVARRMSSWALIAVALALSAYAGFPEVAYLDGLLVTVWVLVRAIGLDRNQLAAYARKVASGAAAGVLLAAPILVAFGDYLRTGYLAGHATGFDAAALNRPSIAALFFPYLYGPIFGFNGYDTTGQLSAFWSNVGGYLTTTLLFLDIVGLYARRLRPLRILLAAWIVVAIGRIYGIPPLQRGFNLLPFMSNVAAYRYLPTALELACVVLAALAIDDVRRKEVPYWALGAALAAGAGSAFAALSTGFGVMHAIRGAPEVHSWEEFSIGWGFAVLAASALATVFLRRHWRIGTVAALVVIDALAMFLVPDFSAPRTASVDTRLVHWLQHHVGRGRFYTFGPFGAEYGSYFGISEADVNDIPVPKAYAHYITTRLDPNVNPVIFVGFTMLTPHGPTPLQEFVTHVSSYEDIGTDYVLASPGFVPPQTVASLHLRLAYADTVADVYGLPHPRPFYRVIRGHCTLSRERLDSVVARCRGPAVLERRELSMAGWTASTATASIPIRTTGSIFQSVRLANGRNEVTYFFTPPHEGAALAALVVGLVAMAASWALGISRKGALRRARHRARRRASSRDSDLQGRRQPVQDVGL